MQIHDYVSRYDSLAQEDEWFDIPERKEYLLGRIGRHRKVLDVGCLGGRLSREILEAGNDVWGLELNAGAAELAAKRGIRVKVADAEEGLPFDDASFDVIHAGSVLEHLYDTKMFFAECRRALRPGGQLLFSVPNLNSLENRIRVAAGGYPSVAGAYPEDHHGRRVRVFNAAKARELCGQTGFAVTDVRGVFHLESRARWLRHGLRVAGRLAPTFSTLLMFAAERK